MAARVHFTDDDRKRVQAAFTPTGQTSLDDLLRAQGDISFIRGVKDAVKAFAYLLYESDLSLSGWDENRLAPWLAHVVARSPNCTCTIDYDGYNYEPEFCPWYSDAKNQRLWHLAYFGLTEEEMAEQEREAQRKKAEAAAREAEFRRAEKLRQLHQLAADFGVDPKYLP